MEKVTTVKLDVEEVEAALDDYLEKEYGLKSMNMTFTIDWEFRKVSGVNVVVERKTKMTSWRASHQ